MRAPCPIRLGRSTLRRGFASHGERTENLEETSMPASKPKIGLIGIGFGAQVYIPGLQSEGWEVAALCSRNREKATKVAEAAAIPNVHTDPLELIRRDDIAA